MQTELGNIYQQKRNYKMEKCNCKIGKVTSKLSFPPDKPIKTYWYAKEEYEYGVKDFRKPPGKVPAIPYENTCKENQGVLRLNEQ